MVHELSVMAIILRVRPLSFLPVDLLSSQSSVNDPPRSGFNPTPAEGPRAFMEPGQVLRFDPANYRHMRFRQVISLSNFRGFAAVFVSIKLESGFFPPTAENDPE